MFVSYINPKHAFVFSSYTFVVYLVFGGWGGLTSFLHTSSTRCLSYHDYRTCFGIAFVVRIGLHFAPAVPLRFMLKTPSVCAEFIIT
jgi:hypothetical protein